jgi:colanic acid biosynthesis glycosyl transferase WcaI
VRLVVHDYSGHPGQAQLSRALARRGHDVVHQYCSSYVSGHGRLERQAQDPETLSFEDVPMNGAFSRYRAGRRIWQEASFGLRLAVAVRRHRPDAVLVSNVPLFAHTIASALLACMRVPQLFWQQDIYSEAIAQAARSRLGRIGELVALVARGCERSVVTLSHRVVCIAPVFRSELAAWGVPLERIRVIPNWGPVDEVTPRSKDNPWARRHGLTGREVVMYSGTIGLKHDPTIFLEIALHLKEHRPEARLVVVSQGRGREWLEAQDAVQAGLDQLVLLDFQPYEDLPDVLGSSDVVLAVLEPGANRFSVPSKVLTYLCAGRPVVAVLPQDNLIAEIVGEHAGIVVPPGESVGAASAIERLLSDEVLRRRCAREGRAYAERCFDIAVIAAEFEAVFREALDRPRSPGRPVAAAR